MLKFNYIIQFFLIFSFLFYGLSCFLSQRIFKEFERYGMSPWRKLTGALQIASCLGLILGFYVPIFTSFAALLLTVMMFVAVLVRLRLRDSVLLTTPAVLYFLMSLFLFVSSIVQFIQD